MLVVGGCVDDVGVAFGLILNVVVVVDVDVCVYFDVYDDVDLDVSVDVGVEVFVCVGVGLDIENYCHVDSGVYVYVVDGDCVGVAVDNFVNFMWVSILMLTLKLVLSLLLLSLILVF